MINQLTLKLNFGANTEGRECSLTFSSYTTAVKCTQLLHNNIFCRKGETNKPTLVTNLLTHSNNTELNFSELWPMYLEELALQFSRKQHLRCIQESLINKLCSEFY